MDRRTPLEEAAARHQAARRRLEEERGALREAIRDAVAGGLSEVRAAELAGVSRPTVRAWLGK